MAKEFATNVQELGEFLAQAQLAEKPMIGRKNFGFRLCDKRRRVIRVDGMSVHVSPAKLRDKDGDTVLTSDGHPVRCVPAKLYNGLDEGDPYTEYREEIADFMRKVLPFGDWKVGQVEFDPDNVKEWEMASEWSPAKIRKWCHEHPYWLVWWQPAEIVDNDVDDLVSVEDFFNTDAVADVSEVL